MQDLSQAMVELSCHWRRVRQRSQHAAGRAQDRESLPARDRRSTTLPRHQLITKLVDDYMQLITNYN